MTKNRKEIIKITGLGTRTKGCWWVTVTIEPPPLDLKRGNSFQEEIPLRAFCQAPLDRPTLSRRPDYAALGPYATFGGHSYRNTQGDAGQPGVGRPGLIWLGATKRFLPSRRIEWRNEPACRRRHEEDAEKQMSLEPHHFLTPGANVMNTERRATDFYILQILSPLVMDAYQSLLSVGPGVLLPA